MQNEKANLDGGGADLYGGWMIFNEPEWESEKRWLWLWSQLKKFNDLGADEIDD